MEIEFGGASKRSSLAGTLLWIDDFAVSRGKAERGEKVHIIEDTCTYYPSCFGL